MKKLWILMIILLSFTSVWTENIYSTSVTDVYKTGYSMVVESELVGYKIGHMQFYYIDSEYSTTRTLYSGNEYIIFAFADDGVKDLDIKVYESDGGYWTLKDKDTKVDNTAAVSIKCARTRKYKITIKAYEFKPGYDNAYYGLLLAWK